MPTAAPPKSSSGAKRRYRWVGRAFAPCDIAEGPLASLGGTVRTYLMRPDIAPVLRGTGVHLAQAMAGGSHVPLLRGAIRNLGRAGGAVEEGHQLPAVVFDVEPRIARQPRRRCINGGPDRQRQD